MPQEYDRLTDAQRERLDVLTEEMGEVAQVVGKIGRHGLLSFNPFDEDRTTNQQRLAEELGNLLYAINLCMAAGDVKKDEVITWARNKASSIRPWLHHQEADLLDALEVKMSGRD